jgi:hypothetical protein
MSTKTQIRSEDYLRMTFEHDAEFVHVEIVERGMPDLNHGRLEGLIFAQFDRLRRSQGLYPCVEVRMKIFASPTSQQVPDKQTSSKNWKSIANGASLTSGLSILPRSASGCTTNSACKTRRRSPFPNIRCS